MKLPEWLSGKTRPQSAETPKAERIRLSGEDYAAQNPYYAAIARGYHIAQMAMFGLLSAFIILSMLIRSDDITYENFFYLFKDIHAAVDSADVSFQTLVYNADETQDFATYRGGLAVAGESGLTVFSATGRQTLIQALNMTSPKLLTSTRCILVYELNGNDYALYNSFVRITSGSTAAPICCAAISDAGWFALGVQDGSSAAISVYDRHSNLKTEHFMKGYLTGLSLNSTGDALAILTTDVVSGAYQSKLSVYRPGTDTPICQMNLEAFFPLSCDFADDDTLYLTATDRMLVLNRDGEIMVELPIETLIHRVFYSEHGFALLGSDATLSLYRKDGTLIGQRTDAQDIRSVLIGKDTVYMMTEHSLLQYTAADGQGTQTDYSFPLQKLLWYSEDELLLCSRSTARFIRMGK